jgi:integrase
VCAFRSSRRRSASSRAATRTWTCAVEGYRPLFEFLACTGLRIGEALGLCWADIDYEAGLIHAYRQLTRHRVHGPLKTPGSKREVVLAPPIAKQLHERWLACRYKRPADLVVCNRDGRGRDYRHVGAAFTAAVARAGITASGRLSLHSLRHGYASFLIAQGLNVVFGSRQLGHANPNITLGVYAHLYARADHAEAARDAIQASYAAMTSSR